MAGPHFPVPIPKERVGGPDGFDPKNDTGPQVPGDQGYGKDGSVYLTHNGGNHKKHLGIEITGRPISDLFVWEE